MTTVYYSSKDAVHPGHTDFKNLRHAGAVQQVVGNKGPILLSDSFFIAFPLRNLGNIHSISSSGWHSIMKWNYDFTGIGNSIMRKLLL